MHMRYWEQLQPLLSVLIVVKDFPLEPAEVSQSSEAGRVAAYINSSQFFFSLSS